MSHFRLNPSRPLRGRRKTAAATRPRLEALETRALLSTITLVKDINPSTSGNQPIQLRNLNGTLLFKANPTPGTGINGYSLYRSDGTEAGTYAITNGGMTSQIRMPSYYSGVMGNQYFFVGQDLEHGSEMWVSDGTAAGTHMIQDIEPGPDSGGGVIITADPAHNRVFFNADDGTLPRSQVWQYDTLLERTHKITYIGDNGNPSDWFVRYGAGDGLTVASTGTYFLGTDSGYGTELYVLEGPNGHSGLLKDINPEYRERGAAFNGYLPWPELDGRLYFPGNNATNGWALWSTDGTGEGTREVADVDAATGSTDAGSAPMSMVAFEGAIYFSSVGADHGRELWKYVPGGINTANVTALVKDINPGPGSSLQVGEPNGTKFTEMNGALYFTADDGVNGIELWRTDGTTDGTSLVKDINPGTSNQGVPNSSSIRGMTPLNGKLYFAASDGSHGFELWESDGTTDGTRMVEDFWPGPNSGVALDTYNEWIVAIGDTLYFTGNRQDVGSEVFKLETGATDTFTMTGTTIAATAGSPFSGTIASFTYSNTSSTQTDFDAKVLWGDGTTIETAQVVSDGAGGFLVTGTHTYAEAGIRTITVNVWDRLGGGADTPTTVNVEPAPPPPPPPPSVPFTAVLDPSCDSGLSDTDWITRDTMPRFHGTAAGGSLVRIVASGRELGQTIATADGLWSVAAATALADGDHLIEVHASYGEARVDMAIGTLVVDTIGPTLGGISYSVRQGQMVFSVRDERAGLDTARLAQLANYRVTPIVAPRWASLARNLATSVVAGPDPGVGPRNVTVLLGGIKRTAPLRFLIEISAAGVLDRAGNPLRGHFTGTFPTSQPGDFQARMAFAGRWVIGPSPMNRTWGARP